MGVLSCNSQGLASQDYRQRSGRQPVGLASPRLKAKGSDFAS